MGEIVVLKSLVGFVGVGGKKGGVGVGVVRVSRTLRFMTLAVRGMQGGLCFLIFLLDCLGIFPLGFF